MERIRMRKQKAEDEQGSPLFQGLALSKVKVKERERLRMEEIGLNNVFEYTEFEITLLSM